LIHELRVHQVELEMQNEELRKAQAEIESSRSRCADLYDFAPAGYYPLDQMGIVKELNLSGAKLLGVERSLIIDKPFQVFIAPEYADTFTHHRLSVLRNVERQRCELKLVRMDKTSFYASMESIATHDDTGNSAWIRSAIVDITELKKKEQTLLESEERLKLLSLQLLNAQEEERKRIAGEVHDTLGSYLGGIRFKAEDVLKQVEKAPGAAVESLNALILMVQECNDECRRIQMDLRPPMLDDPGLRATLSWLLRNFETTYSYIRVKQEIGIEESQIPNALKIVIYRVTQETLNNVVKHSNANLVSFSLNTAHKKVELMITDNGMGFDVDEVLTKERALPGLGLASMKERTRLSGGEFSVTSSNGKGTAIHASWPISK
jgi:PAS domain S-box-containing protein